MIEPILSLAFGMQSNKGAYALLLGSGLSRSAGIPTGWEVVLDLTRKLAAMKSEDCEPDPAAWFQKTFDCDPDYDKVLHTVAKLSSERSQLLRTYFEPNNDQREQGLKVPTAAHKAIAGLVLQGYVRVIITTNFDRLLEQALQGAGFTPTVISTPDSVEGALPLIHTNCTIVKIHGDYLDTRIKNTPGELSTYDKRLSRLLDRIFDEFGLVVCGWSADWDVALRAALERCKSHRFGTFWAVHGMATDAAERLIHHRRADTIKIQDANVFFRELDEKLLALEKVSQPHPLSTKLAVASLKRYIVDDASKISLHDLVMNETERIYTEIVGPEFCTPGESITSQNVLNKIKKYEAIVEILLSLFASGCYWGDARHEYLWAKSLDRLVNLPSGKNVDLTWVTMRLYPALALIYAGGMTAIAARDYSTFAALRTKIIVRSPFGEQPRELSLYPQAVVDQRVGRLFPGLENSYVPMSDHLLHWLRNPLREFLPADDVYEKTFDRFEYLSALVQGDILQKMRREIWGAPGPFVWKHHSGRGSILREIEDELNKEGGDWAPLKAGMFDGSEAKIREIKQGIDKLVSDIRWH
jgi:hypothetical protein